MKDPLQNTWICKKITSFMASSDKSIGMTRHLSLKYRIFKDDITRSVTVRQNGFLAKIEIDKQTRENFKKAISEILQ
jgi:hypothetical protein